MEIKDEISDMGDEILNMSETIGFELTQKDYRRLALEVAAEIHVLCSSILQKTATGLLYLPGILNLHIEVRDGLVYFSRLGTPDTSAFEYDLLKIPLPRWASHYTTTFNQLILGHYPVGGEKDTVTEKYFSASANILINKVESLLSEKIKKFRKDNNIKKPKNETKDIFFDEEVLSAEPKCDEPIVNKYALFIIRKVYRFSMVFRSFNQSSNQSIYFNKFLSLSILNLLDPEAINTMRKIWGFNLLSKFEYHDYVAILHNPDFFNRVARLNSALCIAFLPSQNPALYANHSDNNLVLDEAVSIDYFKMQITQCYGKQYWRYLNRLSLKKPIIGRMLIEKSLEILRSNRNPFSIKVLKQIAATDVNLKLSTISVVTFDAAVRAFFDKYNENTLYGEKTEDENLSLETLCIHFVAQLLIEKESISQATKKWHYKIKLLSSVYYKPAADWYFAEGYLKGKQYLKALSRLTSKGKSKKFYHKVQAEIVDWHKRLASVEKFNISDEKYWEARVNPVKLARLNPQLKFIELNSSAELFNEGRNMAHCVYTYTHDCLTGISCIFSVIHKKTGEKATLEMSSDLKKVKQLSGFSNFLLTPEFENAIRSTAKLLPNAV